MAARFDVIAWKPLLIVATEHRDPHVSHCKTRGEEGEMGGGWEDGEEVKEQKGGKVKNQTHNYNSRTGQGDRRGAYLKEVKSSVSL